MYDIVGEFAFERIDLYLEEDKKLSIVENCKKGAYSQFGDLSIERIETTCKVMQEYPPDNLEEFEKEKKQGKSLFKEIGENVLNMSSTMKKLGLIQFFMVYLLEQLASLVASTK